MTGLHQNPPKRVLDMYSCTVEQWRGLRDLGLKMVAEGQSKDATPLRAYQHQKFAAEVKRGIEFRLTLMEWWDIWEKSGHWADRGLGRGWHMCRIGDQGCYEVGNVFIGEGVENLSAATKVADLPIGVAIAIKGRTRRYRAYCNVGGRQRHIGLFETAEEAQAAYEKALELDNQIKALAEKKFKKLKAEIQGKPLSVVETNAEYAARNRRAAA
ncbi:hypothetical protein [Agrobacterium sp. 10MFCol1.1]|uniref:hypothetical protein n=1 Tax=Agrobacterium sp. 10MFCol1.1 TaxID=1150775 RepID=UPI000360857D|nr:hypothetical protein [Agrobacterium sp. 10MFCol1.1]